MALAPEFAPRVRRDEPLSRHTSWHVGGPAEVFFSPRDRADLASFLRSLPAGVPITWMGLGSNLLVRDGGLRGIVISMHGTLDALARLSETVVRAEAGVACARIARQCIKWGLGPAEFFAGIPGTLGGALAMNAGAFGGETWTHVRTVETIDRTGRTQLRAAAEYRVSCRQVIAPVPESVHRRGVVPSAAPPPTKRGAPAARAAQGDAADRGVELRFGVHQPARGPRRAADRGGGTEGLPHR
jgi:UDP-N-acetylmuramate dehydrogenase